MVTDPYTLAADSLKSILEAEFAPEGFRVLHDNLHPAVGIEGTRIGISPESEIPRAGNFLMNDIRINVKFHGRFAGDIDPESRVDPRKVTNFAERFRRAVQASNGIGNQHVWYWNITSVTYPDDPTGNKTRFHATVLAEGQNSGLVETTG